MRAKRVLAKEVWGHAPQDIFGILDVLRSILLLFGIIRQE